MKHKINDIGGAGEGVGVKGLLFPNFSINHEWEVV